MNAKEILDRKREGRELSTEEIRDFIAGYVKGDVPDYQMSALAMAVCCRGMNARETADLTECMMFSGAVLDWGDGLVTADKHSTGGVGDKLSLVIQPLAAACGLLVPSLTGRGLGLTGGTADKLESIPGYNASLSLDEFRCVIAKIGLSMTVQTAEICPADKKLYALRDVTGTVASIPLITASILSKKLAEGAGTLVFDVKCGKGAFMKTREDAEALARSLVDSAKASGRKAAALVTLMDFPLGRTVGNANEVAESLDMLAMRYDERSDVLALCVELASRMVSLAKDIPVADARVLAWEKLRDGSALAKFGQMVEAHGGSLASFEEARMNAGVHKFKISAMRSGYIRSIDAQAVAKVALELGAGRKKLCDKIDDFAGVDFDVAVGDRVSVGDSLATLSTSRHPDALEAGAAALLDAICISPSKCEVPKLILQEIL